MTGSEEVLQRLPAHEFLARGSTVEDVHVAVGPEGSSTMLRASDKIAETPVPPVIITTGRSRSRSHMSP